MSALVSPISRNPRSRIARLVKLLVERQRLAALAATRERLPLLDPDRHDLDPADAACAELACAHPECCSQPEDYPGWKPGGAA